MRELPLLQYRRRKKRCRYNYARSCTLLLNRGVVVERMQGGFQDV